MMVPNGTDDLPPLGADAMQVTPPVEVDQPNIALMGIDMPDAA